ncbi:MutS-related protein [uncultured Eubacterium sp.]|uniref:lysine 5,6-aminomutase reactivase ATPase KamC n=1 Tax=uncultured Eubacterium sp. TaxID=165185 RepID=UPI0025FEE4E7|nr:DNA mismatch repair protein MutS [uncultured Eubacterium sp.]MCI6536172.1 DNA mismatch repair protein MutS [Lachnospiraceae bacterium]
MIQLTYEQKNSIGLQYILDRLNPSSPYGQERVRRLTPYTVEEQDLLMEELSNLEKLINKKDDLKQEINHLRRIFMQMKDVRPTIKKAREMCLNDIELFEMKNFLIYSEQARSEANYVNGQTKMTGLDYMDLEEALDILDPDGRRIPSFYIYEAYSEKLDDIRKRKRELEKSMEIAAEDTKKEYQNLRHQVVLEEEEEEQIIREQLTKRLQPYLDAMLYNANVTGRMDLLLEKLTATYFGKAVKPVFSQMAGVRKDPVHKDAENDSNHAADISFKLENVTNPWVASVLKERGLEFTPLSIELTQGATVITGANMGGKSISLKTIVLNVLLAMCGFYVYADYAEIPFFENIQMISEELQSVQRGLSSFGAEIIQMKDVIENVEKEFCFVVLDEFSRGTNPHEGAALVRAVTKYLNSRHVVALLVTHFDHVAEYGKAHYQVVGLKDMDESQVQHEIRTAGTEKGVSVIASHMNYGLYRVENEGNCPRDAFRICRLLGLQDDVMDLLEE